MRNFLILSILLIICVSTMSACASSKGGGNNSNETASTGAAQSVKTAENNPTNANETPKQTPAKSADIFASFKKGDDYQKVVRPKIVADGWKPAREEDADKCGSGDDTCDKFPEMNHCAGTGLGNCEFRWQKGDRILLVFTVDDPQVYDNYEIKKAEKTSASNTNDEKWDSFWAKFKTAIDNKDKTALKSLMTEKIDGGGAVETSEERIAAIEESDMWASMQKTVAEGTKADKCDKPCRVSKDGYLVFTYEMTGWKWSGLGGEGGGI